MDLSALNTSAASEKGAEMKVCHPVTGRPLVDEKTNEPVTITLLGRDSKRVRDAERESANVRLQSAVRTRGRMKVTTEELDEDALRIQVAATVSWKHINDENKSVDCTPETARALYLKHNWLREQVDEFINDRSNFLGNSSKSS